MTLDFENETVENLADIMGLDPNRILHLKLANGEEVVGELFVDDAEQNQIVDSIILVNVVRIETIKDYNEDGDIIDLGTFFPYNDVNPDSTFVMIAKHSIVSYTPLSDGFMRLYLHYSYKMYYEVEEELNIEVSLQETDYVDNSSNNVIQFPKFHNGQ